MPIRIYKPTSPGRRSMSVSTFEEITKKEPEKSLIEPLKKHAGRNNRGSHHDPPSRRRRTNGSIASSTSGEIKPGIPAQVAAIEYDPNRSARIALLHYVDGEKRYMLAPVGDEGRGHGDVGAGCSDPHGNALPLRNIPVGTQIHNIELYPGKGWTTLRSAGASAQLMAKSGLFAIRMPSGEVRLVHLNCMATLGQVGNVDHENIVIGKAGRNRHRGRRPTVRGSAMNPRDHPHGGGEGKRQSAASPRPNGGSRSRRDTQQQAHGLDDRAPAHGKAEVTEESWCRGRREGTLHRRQVAREDR